MSPGVFPGKTGGNSQTQWAQDKEKFSSRQLIDPKYAQSMHQKKDEEGHSFLGSVFLATNFVTIVVELAAALFTLYRLKYKFTDALVLKVTLGYYCLYLALTAILLVDSLKSLGELFSSSERDKLKTKEGKLQLFTESTTVLSSLSWIALSALSIVMALGTHNNALQMTSLVLSLAAPLLSAFSAIARAYKVKIEYNGKREDMVSAPSTSGARSATDDRLRKTQHKYTVRACLYTVIAVFETVHLMCHIYEASLLLGNTHLLFSISDKALLVTQASLALLFLVLEGMEHFLDKDLEKDSSQECPNSCIAFQDNIRGAEPVGRVRLSAR